MVRYSESSEAMWAAYTVMEDRPILSTNPALAETVWHPDVSWNQQGTATIFEPWTPVEPPTEETEPQHTVEPRHSVEPQHTVEPRHSVESQHQVKPPHTMAPPSIPNAAKPWTQAPQPQPVSQTPLPQGSTGRNITILPKIHTHGEKIAWTHGGQARYETIRKLGEGGAGEVLLVKDHDIKRQVAMKRIKGGDAGMSLARFVEEVRTIGQLEHPNIVPIYDVGCDEDGNYFFTMKYVEGESLDSVIDKLKAGDPVYHKKYTFERRTQIFITILQAVHYAHQQGFIHRDIKPENVMIGGFGEVMLMDWGIAKRIHGSDQVAPDEQRQFQTQFGAVVGTPAYMSPEQVTGKKLDERSDIYSLCVLFYEFLNLRHYLEHKTTPQEYLFGVIMEEAIDSEKLTTPVQGPVPRELCFFLRQGMKKNPLSRFSSVEEMIQLLQNNLEGLISVHCPATFLKRGCHKAAHFLDNHRFLGVFLAVMMFAVMLLGVFQLGSLLGS